MSAVILSLMFLLQVVQLSQAEQNGGAAIIDSTLVIEGDGEVGSGSIWVNLSIEEVEGDDANTTVTAIISDSEGNQLASENEALQLSSGATQQVSLELENIPAGPLVLNISLSGDLASSPDSDHSLWHETAIARLRPLDIGLGSQVQWLIEAIDAGMNDTGNNSIRDGDGVRLTIPVENNGDIDWNGTFRLIVEGPNGLIQDQNQSISTNGDETTYLVFNLSSLSEGEYQINAILIGVDDDDSSDDSTILTFMVEPPPLAKILMAMNSEVQNPDLAEVVSIVVTLNNSGEADWQGTLICVAADSTTQVLQTQTTLDIDQEESWNITTSAQPGNVVCSLSGEQRLAEDSQQSVSYAFEMLSGNLLPAGGQDISLSGGPWHVGDLVEASVLIHNDGERDANASLWLSDAGQWSQGDMIEIPVGSSMELTASHILSTQGNRNLSWKINSADSLVSEELVGIESLNVSASQNLSVEIISTSWDAVGGITVSWMAELGSGQSRVVDISLGLLIQGERDERVTMQLNLDQGRRTMQSNLGKYAGQALVYIDADPIEWVAVDNQLATQSLPSLRPDVKIEIDKVSKPSRPSPGNSATISCTISNDGARSSEGVLALIGSDGQIISEKEIGRMEGTQTIEFTINSWPDDEDNPLTCRWTADSVHSSTHTYLSDMDPLEQEEGGDFASIPVNEIGTGVAIALGIAILIRLGSNWTGDAEARAERREKREAEREERARNREKDEALAKDEKREISCSNCDQGLKVPSSYSGKVACPSCKNQFEVEAISIPKPVTADEEQFDLEEELLDIEDEDEAEVVEEPEEVTVSSNTDILACPECSSKLRVPIEKRPAMARCPACKAEFRALAE